MCTWRRFLCWSIGPTFHHLVCSGESRAAGHSVHGGLPTGRPGHADGRASSGACWQLLALHAGPRPAPAAPPSKGRARGGGGGACGVGFWRRISSVRQAPWIWQRMLSSASIFSYGDMRLLCSLSMSCRMRAYFFSSDCRSACARVPRRSDRARARRRPQPAQRLPCAPVAPYRRAGQGSRSIARPGRRWSSTRDWRVPGVRRPAPPQGRQAMHSKRDRRAAHGPPEAEGHARRGRPRRPRARASPARAGGRRRGASLGPAPAPLPHRPRKALCLPSLQACQRERAAPALGAP